MDVGSDSGNTFGEFIYEEKNARRNRRLPYQRVSYRGNGASNSGKTEKLKAANSVKVRHILYEKHSKIMEALEKLTVDNVRFDKVAEEYSEDKEKQEGSLG
ncbi:41782_t:CDS:2 [Gigaspora margarita]|uniref:Peptidyl-prolyl cis-trans isomerase n=1 Tax=Gigaspora margarita TaxID=4874 RepID=A0ABN7V0B3_GIGMA|nr:41782_t:CDS:2 [Gigaspora margarita]